MGTVHDLHSLGGQTGLFVGVGRLDPHTYRPNEFFANNWMYEGLVEYGPNGAVLPSLAASWKVADNAEGGQDYTFILRRGVAFHDGTPWDCAAAKLNFDHVLAEPLTTGDFHGWYGLPGQIVSVSCPGPHELVLTTRDKYYPLLQELTYIRPLRMLSPAMFVGGLESDPYTQNSCPCGMGQCHSGGCHYRRVCRHARGVGHRPVEVLRAPSWMRRGRPQRRRFRAMPTTGVPPRPGGCGGHADLIRFPDHKARQAGAPRWQALDVVVGSGPLQPNDVKELQSNPDFHVYFTEPPPESGDRPSTPPRRPPTTCRCARSSSTASTRLPSSTRSLPGWTSPVDALFPQGWPPYCRVDLTPRWGLRPGEGTAAQTARPSQQGQKPFQTAAGSAPGAVVGFAILAALLLRPFVGTGNVHDAPGEARPPIVHASCWRTLALLRRTKLPPVRCSWLHDARFCKMKAHCILFSTAMPIHITVLP